MRSTALTVRGIEDLKVATGANREFRPVQIGTSPVNGGLFISEFGGLRLTHGRFGGDIHVSGTYSNDKLSIGLVLKADGIRCLGKHADVGDMLVAGKGGENDGRYRSELEFAVINVDKAEVINMADSEAIRLCPSWLDGSDLYKIESGKAIRLVQRIRFILEELKNGSFRAMGPEAEKSLADEIVRAFTSGLSGAATSDPIRHESGPKIPKLIQRAESWLASHQHRVPRIEELSEALLVSPRQLYRAFHAEVGMSPARYLRMYRLTRARLELLDADPGATTVKNVAYSLGFWELGRFAVEYKKLFGESPSQTLAAAH